MDKVTKWETATAASTYWNKDATRIIQCREKIFLLYFYFLKATNVLTWNNKAV